MSYKNITESIQSDSEKLSVNPVQTNKLLQISEEIGNISMSVNPVQTNKLLQISEEIGNDLDFLKNHKILSKDENTDLKRLLHILAVFCNNRDIYSDSLMRLLQNIVSNCNNHLNPKDALGVLLQIINEYSNNLECFLSVLESDMESSIVLCCLEHKVVYCRGLQKLFYDSNIQIVHRTLNKLVKLKILQKVSRQTKTTQFYNSIVIRNCKYAGDRQVRKIRYYELTEHAREVFSRLKGHLLKSTKHPGQIENYTIYLQTTHKALQRMADEKEEKLWNAIEKLRQCVGTELYHKRLDIFANNVLLKAGYCITADELEEMVKTYPSISDLQMKKKRVPRSQKRLAHADWGF